MRGRPLLYTSYEADQGLLNTTTKKVMLGLFLLVLVSIPFQVIPGSEFPRPGRLAPAAEQPPRFSPSAPSG